MNNRKWITVYLKDGRRVIEKVEFDRKGVAQPSMDKDLIHHVTVGFNLNYRWDDMLREWILYPYPSTRVQINLAIPKGMTYSEVVQVLQRYDNGQLGERDLGIPSQTSGFPITITVSKLEEFWNRVFP